MPRRVVRRRSRGCSPGFNYHGPDGQIVGDHDFGTISVVGRAPLVLDYEISDNAVYSDGKPITCDDMVLAWASQSGRFPGFDAANRAGYSDIATVDCAPGQKKARVSFARTAAFVDYGQLFAATSMMPSHVIADELGIDVTTAIAQQRRPDDRTHRAGVEHHLEPRRPTRPEAVPVVGALQARLGAGGRRRRARRERQVVGRQAGHQPDHGVAAGCRHPGPRQQGQRRRGRRRGGIVGHVEPCRTTTTATESPSAGIEQLIFASQGPLAAPPARRARRTVHAARCDRPQRGGADRQHAAQPGDRGSRAARPRAPSKRASSAAANPDAARAALNGQPLTVRIGYQSPNARLAATVGAIAKSCAPAGITVQDVAIRRPPAR